MKSLPGKFASARGGTLLLILLLGAGLFVAACGDEEVPAPTTPAPPPPPAPVPEPEPEPEAPAVPVGLMISATGLDFIEWSWTPVEDVSGYDVQYSANQAFTDEDKVIARTAEEFSYRREGLDPETSGYLRVRSASGTEDDRVTSDWSTHVTGTTMAAPPPPEPPAMPTGFMVSDATETSITWTWNAVEGATGYVVQVSMDEIFDDTILGNPETKLFDDLPFTTDTSYTAADLDPETTLYARVAAGAGTPTAPLVSAFTVHATGMTMAARLAAPANLEVKSRGHNFIEWQWDEVEGADGYQAQFSTDAGFSDPDNPLERPGVSNTSARVNNLESEADGYLRVRAYRGTLAARMFGDWSEPDEATTEEAPPPEPLDAPENVRTSNVEDDSITLIWDEVDDAETYEVEFREEGASSWDDADCGNGSNVVDEEQCVATGLEAGTDYDFQVRGIPAGDDDAHRVGAWSDTAETRTDGAAPVQPATPTTSGMGNLKVTWETVADGIKWSWEPVAGATYQWKVVTDDLDFDAEDPCGVDNFTGSGTEFSETSDTGPALLCVRTMDEDDDMKDLSWAFATTAPAGEQIPAVGALTPAGDAGEKTKALTWTGIGVPANFRFDIAIVAEGGGVKPAPTGDDLQEACSAVSLHESDDTDVTLTGLNTTFRSSPQPHTGYLLCLRYGNQRGETDWVPAPTKHYTAPGQAPRPAKDSTLSTDDPDEDDELIVWNVRTRGVSGVPREPADYNFKVITHPTRNDGDDADSLHDDAVTKPTAATCETIVDGDPYAVVAEPAVALTTTGFTVTHTAQRPTSEVPVRTTGTTDEILPNIVSLCVQAEYGPNDEYQGPWNVSSSETVARMRPSP